MTTPETAPVEVTQADIDVGWAAWDMVRADEGNTRLRLVEVFARHRLTPRQDGLREALEIIGGLPTGQTEDVMSGHENAYRAIESRLAALSDTPPPDKASGQ